jgi:hypothetical protein
VTFAAAREPATEPSFCVYGLPFVLDTNLRECRDAFVRLYPQFLISSVAENGLEAVFRSESDEFHWRFREKSGSLRDLRSALWSLESALCEAIIRSQQQWIAIHAATLYSGDSAVLLLGPSGAGKTTLAAALSRRGFTLATDDVALVDPQTLILHPIPRCLHLDSHSILLLEKDGFHLPDVWRRFSFLTPSDLDSRHLPKVGAALLAYVSSPRAERPHLTPVSQSEMAARLLSETGQGPLSDLETLAVFTRIATSAGCFSLTPGPLSETADALSDLVLSQLHSRTAAERVTMVG